MVVVLLAAISVGAWVLAPAYDRAAQQSVLTDRLDAAPANATALHLLAEPVAGESASVGDTAAARVELTKDLNARPTLESLLKEPVGGADVDTVARAGTIEVLALLAYRDRVCAHLTFTDGECALEPGDVAISARSAAEHNLTVGAQLRVAARASADDSAKAQTFTIAGIYQPRDPAEDYWGRGGYFGAGTADPESPLSRVDALFVGAEEDLALPGAQPSVRLDYPLDAAAVRLDDVGRLRTDLGGFTTDVNAAQLRLTTALPSVLDDIDREASALSLIVPVVAVPLVLISLFVLFLIVASLAEERSPEVGLAQLRGYAPGKAARFGRAETVTLVALAVPVGVALGLGAVEAAARLMLAGRVDVEPLRWPVLVAAGLAAVSAYAAVRLGSARALTRPVLALLRRVPQRGRVRAGVLEGIVVALAVASLVVAMSDQTAPLALLAPALVALVAGIVAARALGLWSRVRLRRHIRRGRVSGVLAHAQLSRRPLGQRVILIVTVAVALLSFAAMAWDISDQARRDSAADTVGATRVVRVSAADPGALIAAVDAAAPDGSAMPVVRVTERYGDGLVELVGVRATQLPEVGIWRQYTDSELAGLSADLTPADVAPLTVRGQVELAVTASRIEGSPDLSVIVAPPGASARTERLGALQEGRHVYRATLERCAAGCRLLGFALVPASDAPIAANLAVSGIATVEGSLAAGFDIAQRWQASRTTTGVTVTAGGELTVAVAAPRTDRVVIDYRDAPESLPVVVSGGSPDDDPAADEFSFPGLGETPQRFTVVQRAATLPRAGAHALLFDLDSAVRSAERASALSDSSRLRYEVWANGSAPADLASRLATAGLTVLADESIDSERARLERGAPALGLRLSLLAALAAMLLAVGVVLLTAYVGAAARRDEFAALRVAGVRPAVLRRGLLREYLHLLGVPLVVGAVAGGLAALVILPGLPLVRVGAPAGLVAYTPGPGAVPVAGAVAVVGLGLAVLVVLGLVRRSTPDRIRDGGWSA